MDYNLLRRPASLLTTLLISAWGLLFLGLGAAHAEDDSCPLRDTCVTRGECSQSEKSCVRTTDADCAQSELCQLKGRCFFEADKYEGTCVAAKACAKSPGCTAHGYCENDQSRCGPSDEGCAQSRDCKTDFMCSAHSGPLRVCVSEYCGEAQSCTLFGRCKEVDTSEANCVVGTTKNCMDSRMCKRFGLCQKPTGGTECILTSGGCERSAECRASGACSDSLRVDACVATHDEYCAKSEACKKHGTCSAYNGACTTWKPTGAREICKTTEITGLQATASSTHAPFPPYAFDAAQLVDRDRRTSWQPQSKKGGVGEKLVIKLPPKTVLGRLDIANGFQLADMLGDLFEMNSRAARVLIRIGDVTVAASLNPYERSFIPIGLPPIEADSLEIEILTVEKGWRWNDLAISEIRVYGCLAAPAPTPGDAP